VRPGDLVKAVPFEEGKQKVAVGEAKNVTGGSE
jgi:hypothetical protein